MHSPYPIMIVTDSNDNLKKVSIGIPIMTIPKGQQHVVSKQDFGLHKLKQV